MSRWDGLSPRERAELMALFAREGVTDVRRIRTIYDEGGDIKPAVVDADYPRMKETLDLVNSSDANFVSRLKDANRRTIPDWEVKGNVATHKLGWTTMDGKAYVYPLVQEIDGELYDFTDPKYGFDDYDKAAIDHALSTGDYVAMPKESDARWFTESYKNHYPTFNKYSGGGDKSGDSEVMVRLGEDDYLHQGELDPAVVVAESKKPMTYIPREMFNIVKDKPASEEEMALRKVVDSLVRKDKPTPLTILDSYRSAYRNPFIVNPFAYNIPVVNRFAYGGDEDNNDLYTDEIPASVVYGKDKSYKQKHKEAKLALRTGRKNNRRIISSLSDMLDLPKDAPFPLNILTSNTTIKDDDTYLKSMELASGLSDIDRLKDKVKKARYDRVNNALGINNPLSQVYRWFHRHNTGVNNVMSNKGADIIDLSKNVIRLSPDSKQRTALFNEFVESYYPTVKTAEWYKNNKDTEIIDKFRIPASNINIFGGIEDGMFKIDSLSNFNPNTTVIPARNIRSDIPAIVKLNIKDKERIDDYSDLAIEARKNINSRTAPRAFMGIAYNFYNDDDKKFLKDLISGKLYDTVVSNAKKNGEDISKYDYLKPDNAFNNSMYARNKLLKYIDDQRYFGSTLEEMYDSNFDHDVSRVALKYSRDFNIDMPFNISDMDAGVNPKIAQSESKGQVVDYNNGPYSAFYNPIGDDVRYTFIGTDGKEYPISYYNASVLDGKTVLGNKNGGMFIGRLQDVSNGQLDMINEYLKNNPSWLMRTDLGSFDQYRLDSPTLREYLRQYMEHPSENDPNVYVVGTTKDNKFDVK